MSSRNTRQFLKLPQVVPEEDLLVWGHCRGFGLWPGRIANQSELDGPTDARDDPTRWIHWFGDGKYTETKVSEMTYFYNFWQVFKENVYNHKKLYRKAVNDAIKEAAKRLGKELPENESNGALLTWVKNNLYSPNSVTTTAGDKEKHHWGLTCNFF
ncbi:unnamed protein product [Clavelina lepadiformis]|uniref:PWWP domain-containing protein n=1 Tax=Clavelina lepadiformis TaxID=159417 RepID=A0ABP0FU09_CLALP